ncbi:MAG: hypothetical protein AB8B55_21635 [Mariniblastus sp.]
MKKIMRYSLVLTLLLVFTGGGFLFYRVSQFRLAVSELKAAHKPVSFSDLSVPIAIGAPDASAALRRLVGPLESFEKEMWVDEDVLSRPVDDEMIVRFGELDRAYPEVFRLIDEAIKAGVTGKEISGSYDEVVNGQLLEWQQLRSCARVMNWKMRILAAQGMPDEAVKVGIDILRLSRVGNYPTLVSQLVRNASRGIAIHAIHEVIKESKISDEVRAKLNATLDLHSNFYDYKDALVSERAFGIEMLNTQNMFQIAFNGVSYLEFLETQIDGADKEGFERDLSFEDDFSIVFDGALTGGMIPAIQQVRNSVDRVRSWIRALRIINALEANSGNAKLSEAVLSEDTAVVKKALLEMGVPESMTVDTVSGQLMKIARVKNEWAVYSVGANGVDDGGSHAGIEDYVLGGADEDEDDE